MSPVGEQPLDDSVEVPGIEDDETVRVLGDRLDEAVAVQVLVGKREQQLEIDRLEGEKVARIGCGHIVKRTIR